MFVLGIALWVFLALVGVGIAIIYAVEHEHSFGAFMGILASGLLLHFTGTVNMLDVLHNWQQLLMFLGAYVLAGVLWSMLKWRSFVFEWAAVQVERLKECKVQFLFSIQRETKETFEDGEIPVKYAKLFELWSEGKPCYDLSNQIMGTGVGLGSASTPIESKEQLGILRNMPRILVWCLYWPFSMLWTLIDDPFKKLVQFLVIKVLGGIFAAISQSGVNTVEKQRQAMIKKG